MQKGHRQLWAAEEDDQLRELMAANASATLMSAKLKRSTQAIRMRCLVLRKRWGTDADKKGDVDRSPR